jgi:hypothetical protein
MQKVLEYQHPAAACHQIAAEAKTARYKNNLRHGRGLKGDQERRKKSSVAKNSRTGTN